MADEPILQSVAQIVFGHVMFGVVILNQRTQLLESFRVIANMFDQNTFAHVSESIGTEFFGHCECNNFAK